MLIVLYYANYRPSPPVPIYVLYALVYHQFKFNTMQSITVIYSMTRYTGYTYYTADRIASSPI